MKDIFRHSTITLLVCFLLLGCKKEAVGPAMEKDGLFYMSIGVNSFGNTNPQDEDAIYKIRTIVTAFNGTVVSNELHTTTAPTDGSHTIAIKTNFGSGYTIYAICNEADELTGKLNNVTAESVLDNLRYSSLNIKCPLMMFGKQDGLTIQINPNTKKTEVLKGNALWTEPTINVERTMVKISLTAIKNASVDDLFSIEQMSYSIHQVPKYGLLKNINKVHYNSADGWETITDIPCTGKLSLNANDATYVVNGDAVTVTGESITSDDIYIPEHLIDTENAESSDYCTYLLLHAKCKRGENSHIYNINYRINLGENSPVDHNLRRNYNYRVYATITGISTMGFHAEIVPMAEYNIPIIWEPFQGYTIMGESEAESETNIINNFSQYSGILKISKNNVYQDALFRYGSVIAVSSGTTNSNFNVNNDILWKPDVVQSPISAWGDIQYQSSGGDVNDTAHTLENLKQGKGDPCRLVGLTNSEITSGTYDNGQWKMATSAQMQELNVAQNDTRKPKGFYSYNYLLTPYTGQRGGGVGNLVAKGNNGYYWSSTARTAFVFNNVAKADGILTADTPDKAYAIRCVRTHIPPSRVSALDVFINYNGAVDIPIEVADNFLVPYWKMKLVNDADKAVVSFSKDNGIYNQNAICTVQPSATPYSNVSYPIDMTGYGLDGFVHHKTVNIRQIPLKHDITLDISSNVPLDERNGYIRVPQTGATLSVRLIITPEPQAPFLATFANQEWHVTMKYYNYQQNTILGTTVTTQDPSILEIPENLWGNTVSLNITMTPVNALALPPFTTTTLVYIQEFTK